MEKKNQLSIAGNVCYSTEVSDAVAAKIIALCALSGDLQSISSQNVPQKNNWTLVEETESVSEYMDKLQPKRNPDKILCIAGYMATKGKKYFSAQDIKPYFAKAGEPVPANFTRDFKWVIATKWIAEADDKRGAYYVTNKGLRVIEGGFHKDMIKETRGKSAGRGVGVNKSQR